jgi:hypothetical protein
MLRHTVPPDWICGGGRRPADLVSCDGEVGAQAGDLLEQVHAAAAEPLSTSGAEPTVSRTSLQADARRAGTHQPAHLEDPAT